MRCLSGFYAYRVFMPIEFLLYDYRVFTMPIGFSHYDYRVFTMPIGSLRLSPYKKLPSEFPDRHRCLSGFVVLSEFCTNAHKFGKKSKSVGKPTLSFYTYVEHY